jgi:polyisoprenoid-binding protein YceI
MRFHGVIWVVAALAVAPACKKPEDKQPPAPVATSAADAAPAPAVADGPGVPVPELPQVTTWKLDPENSAVTFVSRHANHTNVRGMFKLPAGTVVLDEATPANSRVSATIEVTSMTTGVDERDTHLKSADFFDVARFPQITFVSTGVSRSSDGAYVVTGDVTMHGVTKPVTLEVTASPPFQHFGSIRRGIEATTTINRQDFGVGTEPWNAEAESGGLLIGNAVKVTIDAELVLEPEPGQGG